MAPGVKLPALTYPAGSMQYLSSLSKQTGPSQGAPFVFVTIGRPMPSHDQINDVLRRVIDPELRKDIVSLGMVRSIEQPDPGRVDVMVSLTTPGCPIRSHFEQAVAENVRALEGVEHVGVSFDVLTPDEKKGLQQKLGRD